MKITITLYPNGVANNAGKRQITHGLEIFGHYIDYRFVNETFISNLIYGLKKDKSRVVITKTKTDSTVNEHIVVKWTIQFLM